MHGLNRELQDLLDHLAHRNFESRDLVFDPPARKADVEDVEAALGLKLPQVFREVLLAVSRRVVFSWSAPDDHKFPPPFRSNFSGEIEWAIDLLPEYERARKEWIEGVFPDPRDACGAVWRDKLAFLPVANGDYLSIDLSPAGYERIVYLSHEGDESNGYVMADDFANLLERWVPLACAGAEDWQWLPFTNNRTSPIDPNCENARAWRRLLGLLS